MGEPLLLDTNVVSEMLRTAPDPRVIAFLNREPELWLSAVVVHELEFGIGQMAEGRRRNRLRRAVSDFLRAYRDHILPVGRREAECAAGLRVRARREGRPLMLADALIGGTAVAQGMVLATRNMRDFGSLDVPVVNPWEPL